MDLGQVTLSQMRYAVAIGELQSFRLAAQRCHVSQSGLSMQIQRLEELLGVVLFDRGRKPVLPTREGEAALALARSHSAHPDTEVALRRERLALAAALAVGACPAAGVDGDARSLLRRP